MTNGLEEHRWFQAGVSSWLATRGLRNIYIQLITPHITKLQDFKGI